MTGKSSTQIARDNTERFLNAYSNGHEDYVKDAEKNNNFYIGDQWDEGDKAKLDSEGRPALTLNTVLSTVNAIIGEQLERKIEVRYSAGPGGSPDVASRLNVVTRAILNSNKFDDIEEQVFADGLITDRGFYDIRLDFERNIHGDIAISDEDGVDIIIDPNAKSYDPNDWNEVFISRWMTPDEIEVEFGSDKIREIRRLAETGSQYDRNSYEYQKSTYGDDTGYGADVNTDEARALVRLRVVERQHYKLTKRQHFVDLETGDLRPVPYGMTKAEAEEIANRYGVGLVKRTARRVRQTISVDEVLLYDDWSIYRTFTIVPFFPYFRRGRPFGVVKNLRDPQELLNKTSSQELHIVNTTANSGWKVQEGSLVGMTSEDLEERGAETGLVLTYKRGFEAPDKITPNSIPTGIDRISQKAANTIREVSAVNAAMIGANRADQSGKAIDKSISQGQVQVSVVLNNLTKSRGMVARKILELIQDFYTETRYFKISGEQALFGGLTEGQVGINERDEQGNVFNNVGVGKYDIEVTHAPAGGSYHQAQFTEALQLRHEGVRIPDHVVVAHSNLHKREELAEFLKKSQGFGELTPEQQEFERFKHQITMQSMQNEVELQTAEIEQKMANARQAMAKANSMEGYNEARIEYERLMLQRENNIRDMALRISLAARSHQNAQTLNDKRISSQILLESMKQLGNQNPQSPKTDME